VAPGASTRFLVGTRYRRGEARVAGPHELRGGTLKPDDLEVRHARATGMRAKAVDPGFRAAPSRNMAHHSEWKAVLGG